MAKGAATTSPSLVSKPVGGRQHYARHLAGGSTTVNFHISDVIDNIKTTQPRPTQGPGPQVRAVWRDLLHPVRLQSEQSQKGSHVERLTRWASWAPHSWQPDTAAPDAGAEGAAQTPCARLPQLLWHQPMRVRMSMLPTQMLCLHRGQACSYRKRNDAPADVQRPIAIGARLTTAGTSSYHATQWRQ